MHAFVVTTFESDRARQAHAAARSTFGSQLVTSIIEDAGSWSFAVFCGDGTQRQRQQARLRSWLQGTRYSDGSSPYGWTELAYGEGQPPTVISSDQDDGRKKRGR